MPARFIRRLTALLLLALTAGGCTFEPKHSKIPAAGTSVPLSFNEHQPGIDVTLNGRGPYHVLVDTGASPAIAVTPALARELGLRRHLGYVRLRAANGRWVRAGRTRLGSVRLGGAMFYDVPAVILDIGGPEFAAVVGMGLFSRGTVTIDFPNRTLSLDQGKLDTNDPDVFTTPFVYGIPLVPVAPPLLEDAQGTVHVLLDTGSNGGLIMPASFRDKLALHPDVSGSALADTLGGTRTIELVRLRGKLTLGRYASNDPLVGLAPGRGAIGTVSLRDFEVGIDPRSRRVRLKLVRKPAPSTAPPSPARAPATRPAPRTAAR